MGEGDQSLHIPSLTHCLYCKPMLNCYEIYSKYLSTLNLQELYDWNESRCHLNIWSTMSVTLCLSHNFRQIEPWYYNFTYFLKIFFQTFYWFLRITLLNQIYFHQFSTFIFILIVLQFTGFISMLYFCWFGQHSTWRMNIGYKQSECGWSIYNEIFTKIVVGGTLYKTLSWVMLLTF